MATVFFPTPCANVAALKWRVSECHNGSCPVSIDAVDVSNVFYSPAQPIVVQLDSSSHQNVFIQTEVFPDQLPIVSGDLYGIRVEAILTGKVLYQEELPVEMPTCFSTHPECRGAEVNLPTAQLLAGGDFQAAHSCVP
jgi:hypothetical protein